MGITGVYHAASQVLVVGRVGSSSQQTPYSALLYEHEAVAQARGVGEAKSRKTALAMIFDEENIEAEVQQEYGLATPQTTRERRGPVPAIVSSLDFLNSPYTISLIGKAANLESQRHIPTATADLWIHITKSYFLHHSNAHLLLSLVPIGADHGTTTFAVVRNIPTSSSSNVMRILLLVTCVAHGPYWDQVFQGLQLPERTFDLQLRNYILVNFGEVDVNWVLANSTMAEIRTIMVSRQDSNLIHGSDRCDLTLTRERESIGDWLQGLSRIASHST
ncbi:hypothetical protein E2P81_ATG04299 [Venturia nashicola]|uniref:Uncharacterized protein n=1 Tax=Venturia nashicola TaxID=86259 RepID=A0A4Z1P9L8_9PEZI|nr:hypothetical protein E6O75_ATG04400 [Venturia nashicola]TLD37487.1 hypothetical protein E2P81_ATG04299 [Venturia nashicola]